MASRGDELRKKMEKSSKQNIEQSGAVNGAVLISVNNIELNPFQPRKIFDQKKLESLARTILKDGLIHPIAVKRNDSGYTLVAGERRLRAVKTVLKQPEIKAYIIEDEVDLERVALIENVHREELCLIDLAEALSKLLVKFKSEREMAAYLSMSSSHVNRIIKMVNFGEDEKIFIRENEINQPNILEKILKVESSRHMELLEKLLNKTISAADYTFKKNKSDIDIKSYFSHIKIDGLKTSSSAKKINLSFEKKDFSEEKMNKILEYIAKI